MKPDLKQLGENDPYAELKAAWEAGRRIRCKYWPVIDWCAESGFWGGLKWSHPLESYEIEPLPAEKWAAEKKAHAEGKRIETKAANDPTSPWFSCLNPTWQDYNEYRIAPDPAPAGKLSDKELGEIGAKAANRAQLSKDGTTIINLFGPNDEPARTAFAAAVREQVEKEQAEEIDRLLADAIGAKETFSQAIVSEQAKKHDALYKLAAAEKRLAELEWRPVNLGLPTDKDGDSLGYLYACDKKGVQSRHFWHCINGTYHTHWRPASPPLKPTAEEIEREKFNAWYDARCKDPSQHKTQLREAMFDSWQAARASKEVQPSSPGNENLLANG